MNNKDHLVTEGFNKILAIKASMNLGLSKLLMESFPDIKPISRPVLEVAENINPFWIAGFTNAEGCFFVKISKDKTNIGYTVSLRFIITQHSRDAKLMNRLVTYFGCGSYKVRSTGTAGDFVVNKFTDINEKIIPVFKKISNSRC